MAPPMESVVDSQKIDSIDIDMYLCGQLMKDYPTANLFNVHENLIEALLELQAYADVQALLVKYDGQ